MNNKTTLWALVAVIAVAALAWWFLSKGGSSDASQYKAVFLSNGQLYFGKVADEKSDPVVLSDIFYLRVQRQVQPVQEGGDQAANQQQNQVNLIKFGKAEVHGPEDEMRITREQILYIETLREKGQVVKAIKEYQKSLEEKENSDEGEDTADKTEENKDDTKADENKADKKE